MPKKFRKFKQQARASSPRVRKVRRVVRHPLFTVPVATFMVLLTLSVAAFVVLQSRNPKLLSDDSHVVIISYDKKEQTVPTRAATVGDLLRKVDIKLNPGDVVEPAPNTEIVEDNFRVNVYRAVPVTIIDGDQKSFTYSAAATPRSIVKHAGVHVFPEDNLDLLPTTNFLTDNSIGQRVVIDRATPVNMNLYGTPVVMRTHATTVGELLKERKVKLGKDDDVQPKASTVLTPNTQVFVVRKGTQIVTEEKPIDMPKETVEDASLTFGTTVVRQQGAPGKKLITYSVELQNGKEISRKQIQEVVSQQPVKQIEAKGKAVQIPNDKQAVMRLAGISPSDFAYVDYIVSRESGWCPTKLQGQYGGCPPYPPASIPGGLGYGLVQATPGGKMSSAGSDWQVNPVTQLKWASGYANRYGGWAGAYAHWQSNHYW